MSDRKKIGVGLAVLAFFLSGCATGRNYQADIDSLNAKVSALESQILTKDQEIARLQNAIRSEEVARSQAEAERRLLVDKLDKALSQLESRKAKAPESDLK